MSLGEKLAWITAYVLLIVLTSPMWIWFLKAWWFAVGEALAWSPT